MHRLPATITDFTRDRRAFAPADEGNSGDTATTTTPPPDTTIQTQTTQTAQTTAKWWEGDRFADPARQFLTAKGLTVDDPLEAMPKLADMAMNFEKRIGKGLDQILDKPAKGQTFDDWVAQNREALGLPKDEAGYEIARPDFWPKDAPWNDKAEAEAKAIALKRGVSKEALNDFINLQARIAAETYQQAEDLGEKAKAKLMEDLQRDYGDKTPAVIQRARLGAEAVAQKAGLQMDAVANLSDVLTAKIGDANAIRFMAAIGEMLGDDGAVGLGRGGGLTTTPAEARAELARMRSPDGEYYKATASGNRTEIARLQPTIDRLSRLAAG